MTTYLRTAKTTATNRRLISYSEIASLSCFRKHHFSYGMGLRKADRSPALRFGSAWDEALNDYYHPRWNDAGTQGDRIAAALDAGVAQIMSDARELDGFLVDRGIPRPRDWQTRIDEHTDMLRGMLEHYAMHYGDERDAWRSIDVQVRFEVPFPSANGKRKSTRYWLHGVIDRVMEHRDTGAMYLVDAKTAAGIDDAYKRQYDLDRQLPLYGWALRELGWPIVGHQIDVAAKKVPRMPKVTKRGVLEKLIGDDGKPRIRTTAALTRQAIHANGLSEADYRVELATLAAYETELMSTYFWREDLHLNDYDFEDAAESLRSAATIIDRVPPIAMPNQMACGWCDFRDICKNPDPRVIATEFTTRDERRDMRRACEAPTPEAPPVDDDPIPF